MRVSPGTPGQSQPARKPAGLPVPPVIRPDHAGSTVFRMDWTNTRQPAGAGWARWEAAVVVLRLFPGAQSAVQHLLLGIACCQGIKFCS